MPPQSFSSYFMPYSSLDVSASSLKKKGHVCIRNAIPQQELREILAEIMSIVGPLNLLTSPQAALEESVTSYGQGWTFRENLWRISPSLRRYFVSGSLAQLTTALFHLLCGDGIKVCLLRDQTYFKAPYSETTPWHQDGTFIPLPLLRSLTFWIPFHAIDSSMSPMHYLDGSHLSCWIGGGHIGEKHDSRSRGYANYDSFVRSIGPQSSNITVYDSLEPGDILVHDSWALHGTPTHAGDKPRLAIVVVYYILDGTVELIPSLRLASPEDTAQACLLRRLNLIDLFPSMDGRALRSVNSRTPSLQC